MDLQLGGTVAVVTGASEGIGLAVVRTPAAEGAAVVAGARTVDTLAGLDGSPRSRSTSHIPAPPKRSSSGMAVSTCSSTTWVG